MNKDFVQEIIKDTLDKIKRVQTKTINDTIHVMETMKVFTSTLKEDVEAEDLEVHIRAIADNVKYITILNNFTTVILANDMQTPTDIKYCVCSAISAESSNRMFKDVEKIDIANDVLALNLANKLEDDILYNYILHDVIEHDRKQYGSELVDKLLYNLKIA